MPNDLVLSISVSPEGGRVPLTVTITGISNNQVNAWNWYIDGVEQAETTQQITKVFTNVGVHSIALRATDIYGQGDQVFAADSSILSIIIPNITNISDGSTVKLINDGGNLPTGLRPNLSYTVIGETGAGPTGSFQLTTSTKQAFTTDAGYTGCFSVITTPAISEGTAVRLNYDEQIFTIVSGLTGYITTPGAFYNGTAVEVRNEGGVLPYGLTGSLTYYTINRINQSFQLSTSIGGLPIPFTGAPSGINYIHGFLPTGLNDSDTYYVVASKGNSFRLYSNGISRQALGYTGYYLKVTNAISADTAVMLKGALPVGLTSDIVYYGLSGGTSFQISTSKGGPSVGFSGVGLGTNYLQPIIDFSDNGSGTNYLQSIVGFTGTGTGINYITKETFTSVSVVGGLSTPDIAIYPSDPRGIMQMIGSVDAVYASPGIGVKS